MRAFKNKRTSIAQKLRPNCKVSKGQQIQKKKYTPGHIGRKLKHLRKQKSNKGVKRVRKWDTEQAKIQ